MSEAYVPGTSVRDGDKCPTCHQRVQLYRRTLYNVPARMLIVIYNIDPYGYVYIPPLCLLHKLPGGDATMGHHWGLLAAQPAEREDGSDRVGWWRLTYSGRRFVQGRLWVRRYARVYNQQCHGHEGRLWHVTDALGQRFDYRQLMNGDPP